jgi:hypothetical protein
VACEKVYQAMTCHLMALPCGVVMSELLVAE